jgi:hypothetical protein
VIGRRAQAMATPAGTTRQVGATEKHGLQTLVCICEDRRMSEFESDSIAIKLTPAQVDAVVRAAARGRAPSISALNSRRLSTQSAQTNGRRSRSSAGAGARGGRAGASSEQDAPAARTGRGYLPSDTDDPRLSRSLLRGLSLLAGFGPDGAERGIVELADELGMSASTAHRYALTLVELGLLERCPSTRKYRLPAL